MLLGKRESMKLLAANLKEQGRQTGQDIMCPNCTRTTNSVDRCEWCGSTLLRGKPESSNGEMLAAKEQAKAKAQEVLQEILAGQRPREHKKRIKIPKEKNFVLKKPLLAEDITEPGLESEIDKEKFLEVYPVNEPYAYVGISKNEPHTYQVIEAGLTRGEEELLKEIRSWLYEVINLDFASLDKPEDFLRQKVLEITREFGIRLSPLSMEKIMYYVARDLIGFGRLDPILRDKRAEDISADGAGIPVFVYHQKYGSLETSVTFTHEELDSLIYKLAQRSGRHISMAKPLLDASLPNHDRLQLSIGSQVTTRGSTFTIRKFRETPFTPVDLITMGTISVEMAVYLWMAVENGFNILIAGGTASGKTTFLNTISMFIPPGSKIVSIEDTREINLAHQNWIPSVTRETEERGSIEMFDLLRTALRQRPEYLLVGEVRGQEASTLFQAMATGHITFSTVHADSVESLVKRLTKPPIDVPLMLLDSIDIVAMVSMVKIGDVRARRCTNVTEVTGIDFDKGTLKTNVVFRLATGQFQFSGESKVFLETMEKLNMSEEQLAAEYSRRLRIMNLLCEKKINDFHRLSKLFFEYTVHPDEVEKSLLQGELL
jgi:archaeal flagellar protein FlaI